jgi:hypothetical protein
MGILRHIHETNKRKVMIETHRDPEFETDTFVRDIKRITIICLSFFVTFVFVSWLLMRIDEPELSPCASVIQLDIEYPCDTVHIERATTYQATTAQCDSNPLTTADGSKINPDDYQRWVALSRDLLSRWGGEFNYGDKIEVYSKDHPNLNGEWEIHDCMASRYTMSIDFLMEPEKNYPKLGIGKDIKILVCSENN